MFVDSGWSARAVLCLLTFLWGVVAGCGDDSSGKNANLNNNNNILVGVCGNGVVEGEEECDDGDDNSDVVADACRTDCRNPYCGDGTHDSTEGCDDGAQNSDTESDACRTDCKLPYCGDGVYDPGRGEGCDCGDGSVPVPDGCNGMPNSTDPEAVCSPLCEHTQCGDGVKQGQEECDGNDTGDVTCESRGFAGGTLGCHPNCTLDMTTCTDGCGNGVIEPGVGEQCDGDEMGGMLCVNMGFEGGVLSCSDDCRFDLSLCTSGCGNGVIDDDIGEQCDTANLDQQSCEDFGFSGGTLSCTESCRFDLTSCVEGCGNGVIEGQEECDATNLAGNGCGDFGFGGGVLRCDESCRFSFSMCADGCGNGIIENSEECDATNLAGNGCGDFGFGGGVLSCDDNCEFVLTGCVDGCGNEVIEPGIGEQCEPGDLMGAACADLGFTGGVLACGSDCRYDLTGCVGGCGNGVIEGDEQCDDGALNSDVEPDACRMDCHQAACGDGTVDSDESCDDGANGDSCDGCRDDCNIAVITGCGDGYICPGEQCDDGGGVDGDGVDGDGCSSSCGVELDWQCLGEPSVCWHWIALAGGTYDMGSTDGSSDEEPVHSVVIPGFEMMETEVTNRQYETCVNAGVCTPPDTSAHCNWNVSGREHHPVNCISWQQAVDFCTWIGGRLPSESEWEYAARSGGQDIIYPWGDDEADCDYAVMRDWQGDGCGNDRTWEVCSKSNGNTDQGLCDMSGNVFEWTQDRYHGSYDCDANPAAEYCELGGVAPDDGSAWESNNTSPYRIRRGGWYGATENSVRAAYRGVGHPGAQSYSTGVRCAR